MKKSSGANNVEVSKAASAFGRLLVPAMLLAVAMSGTLGWIGTASALPCLGDTIGEPVNCTANDIRITDFHDIVVTDDGCVSQGDTVTFDAVLTVVTTATSRYDIGLFIGTDGRQAINGQCQVRALPTGPLPFRQLDGDACGDTSSAATVNVRVSNVTVNCVDANANRMLDVASCTSWQQNAVQACNGAADIEPGTAAKCNCPELPADIPIFVPELICTSNAECDANATGCNDGICNPGDPDAEASGCVFTSNDANCDDHRFCNGAETCSTTLGCRGGTPPNCADAVACTVDACNASSDTCTHAPSNSPCSDGVFCNGAETCNATLGCQAGAPPDCVDAVACTVDACNESTDSCTHAPSHSLCSDGLFCDGEETCSATLGCQAGAAPSCVDAVSCTVDACNESTDSCTHAPSDSVCSDGLFCSGAETCDALLGCRPGTPPDCADEIACTRDACNESRNDCTHVPNDVVCMDGLFCSGTETCSATLGCQAGVPPNCADSVACTLDTCDENTDGCIRTPDDFLCSDGLFCTGAETCSALLGCQAGVAPVCTDTVACTANSCNETADRCDVIPNNALCADSDICTDDRCSPLSGCGNPNNTAFCDDHNECTGDDRCANGQCLPGGSVCGNGVVNTTCGEECDAGSGEICANGLDDDGDGLTDCADPDCSNPAALGCDAECLLVPACVGILNDPAIIYMHDDGERAQGNGRFSFHGRMVPLTPVDPLVDGFVVTIGNANGEIYRAEVGPGDLRENSRKRYSLNATAAAIALNNGGIHSLHIRQRKDDGETGFGFRVKATGDYSRATLELMTTQVYFGNNVAYLTATWTQRPGRWTLYQRHLKNQQP